MIRKLILISLVFVISACQPKTTSVDIKQDSENSKVPQRIITLSPHLTELVYSLGAQDRLIATVEYSDYPEAAKDIPRIGNAFQIDWERLVTINPDLIIVWDGGNPKAVIEELEKNNYPLLKLGNAKLFSLPEQVDVIAERLEINKDTVKKLNQDYINGLTQLQNQYEAKETIKVLYQISPSPIYTVDGRHVISEMLALCGASNIFDKLNSTGTPVSTEAVIAAKPDVILTGLPMYDAVLANWENLTFVPKENILPIDEDQVSRASFRMLEGARNICKTLDEWRQNH